MILSTAIAHTQTEQTIRPIITLLTIQWACQNSVKIDRSDGATSGGIMTHPFGSMATANPAGADARTSQRGQIRTRSGPSTFGVSREIDEPLSAITNSPRKMSNLRRHRRYRP